MYHNKSVSGPMHVVVWYMHIVHVVCTQWYHLCMCACLPGFLMEYGYVFYLDFREDAAFLECSQLISSLMKRIHCEIIVSLAGSRDKMSRVPTRGTWVASVRSLVPQPCTHSSSVGWPGEGYEEKFGLVSTPEGQIAAFVEVGGVIEVFGYIEY